MFNNQRYITKGVQADIPFELQFFMWECINKISETCDYFQIFELENVNGIQKVTHFSEHPEYQMEYLLPTIANPITEKISVIDDRDYSTMLLAEEY